MKQLILSDITAKMGRYNEDYIYELTWVDIETLQVYSTIVDCTYRNYTRSGWDTIINNKQLGIYDRLRLTAKQDKDALPVISADSHPRLLAACTEREIEQMIELQQEQTLIFS